ncbi:hypothetical protein CLI64_25730 [Nostoc sp. CENA543]|nr:hypothetical protein CLI64_25730 [Nostoc sp. CENA543]
MVTLPLLSNINRISILLYKLIGAEVGKTGFTTEFLSFGYKNNIECILRHLGITRGKFDCQMLQVSFSYTHWQ